ncbi:hypothetical protein [Candidatus Neomicrothrix sp.]|uniref:hypothetical protein n=1 Tax=Candidatus Neomicrothrix sp. TaxID=2719034 RepID=UPI0025BA5D3A|nr:hypothetical protein [Candidatus Microthrix sp.]
MTRSGLHERQHVDISEPGQIDSGHVRLTSGISQKGGQPVTACQITVAVGRDNDHRGGDTDGEYVTQQLQGGRIGPLHVVEDHDDQPVRPGAFQQVSHRT